MIAIMGVYLGHDLGACLLVNGRIVAMIEEERLNRFKHGRPYEVGNLWGQFAGKFGYFPWASVSYCLEVGSRSIDDLDAIIVGGVSLALTTYDAIRSVIPIKDRGKVMFINEPQGAAHHFHHALSAFLASPFEEAAVLVVDGDGSYNEEGYEAETGFHFESRTSSYKQVFKNRYTEVKAPRSGIGWTYEQVTLLLGFANSRVFIGDPGKTMGLSSYGRPRAEFERPWIQYNGFKLDFSGFHEWLSETGYDSTILSYNNGLATRPGGVSQYAKDLAFKVQSEIEAAMLYLAREMRRVTQTSSLCLAGGVALNSVANGVIAAKGPFENIFIQPAANDGGQSIGLAYHGHLLLTSSRSNSFPSSLSSSVHPPISETEPFSFAAIRPINHAYGGRTYCSEEIHQLLSRSGLAFREFPDDEALVQDAAKELAGRRIIGWFQGGSEYGPRALGHRSILANPDRKEMKDLLNHRIKFRESFRPFAPSVLLDRAGEVFHLERESPYMLLVAPVRESWKQRVPAITHVDGTARVQTVDPEVDPLYYSLISAFERTTGIPLVVNTSFNLRGMPIIESPHDALQCFLFTNLDCLYLGCYKLDRPDSSLWFPMKSPRWRQIAANNVDSELIDLYEACDGTLSMRAAFDKTYRKTTRSNDQEFLLEDAIRSVQNLARQGAILIRAGLLIFSMPEIRSHQLCPRCKLLMVDKFRELE